MDEPTEPTGEQPIDRRRTSREEGQMLLFGSAVDLARRQGSLQEEQTPLFEHSRMSSTSYALVDEGGTVLARIPLVAARKRLKQRCRIARRLLKRPVAKLPSYARAGISGLTLNQLRLLEETQRALAWAIGSGEPFPDPGFRVLEALITLGLLALCVLPGLWYASHRARQKRLSKAQMKELVARWRSKGRPDPPESFFTLYNR